MKRIPSNTIKIPTTFGPVYVHIDTDRPCHVVGWSVATPQKLEKTALYTFIEQLVYDPDPLG